MRTGAQHAAVTSPAPLQSAACAAIARHAHSLGLDVWAYTGYTYEQLLALADTHADIADLLSQIDVLVDGPFLLSERSLDLDFCGSRNQRLIDLPKSRAANAVVLWQKPQW